MSLTDTTVARNVQVLAGTGASSIDIDTVNADGVSIQTGDQDDAVTIDTLNVTGRFVTDMNLGADSVSIANSDFGSAIFDGGEGSDSISYLGAGNTFVDDPIMVSFEAVS